jgi:hypothetical protein
VLYVNGYSDDYKNDISLIVSGYVEEDRFLEEAKKIHQWRSNCSSSRHDELYELPVNGVIEIICNVEFDEIKIKDNNGQGKKEDLSKETQAPDIRESVSFVIHVEYSRFNKK